MRREFLSKMVFAIVVFSFGFIQQNHAQDDKYKTFDNTLVIHLYHGGGMLFESLDIYVRYDSCVRVNSKLGKETRTSFAMNDDLRKKIISIISETNASKIKMYETESFDPGRVTRSICFNLNGHKDFCIVSNASKEIKKNSMEDFTILWTMLQEFSQNKGKIMKF